MQGRTGAPRRCGRAMLRLGAAIGGAMVLAGCADRAEAPLAPSAEPLTSIAGGVINGENYLVQDLGGTIFLGFGGTLWGYPDWDTFLACNGGHANRFRTVSSSGTTPRRVLPTVNGSPSEYRNEWMRGLRPVMGSANGTVWVIVGCVRAGIPDAATFEAIFGSNGWGRIVTVPQSVIDQFPTGPNATAPIRPSGTLIKSTAGATVRWVTYHGGALGIPSEQVLSSHCRTLGEVLDISPSAFASYAETGVMQGSTGPCPSDYRLPLGGGLNWSVSAGIDATHHQGADQYSIDFTQSGRSNVRVLASAAGVIDNFRWSVPDPAAPSCPNGPDSGNFVRIRHNDNTYTSYFHLSYNSIPAHLRQQNQPIARGEYLGTMGRTGCTAGSTGIHLHFRVNRGSPSGFDTTLRGFLVDGRRLEDYRAGNSYPSTNLP